MCSFRHLLLLQYGETVGIAFVLATTHNGEWSGHELVLG